MRVAVWLIAFVALVSTWGLTNAAVARASDLSITVAEPQLNFPSGVTFNAKAAGDMTIVRAEFLYRRAEEETLHLTEADIEPAKEIDVSLELDLQVNYAPPGIDISYRWRFVDEQGGIHESELATVLWFDTRFTWESQSSEDVTVYSYSGEDGFDRYVLETAQSSIGQLESDYGVSGSDHIRIWLYSSRGDFQGAQAPNSESWAVGLAMPAYQVITAAIEPGDEWAVGRTIPHEISHQVLYQATRNPFNAPATWFDEGVAGIAQLEGADGFDSVVAEAAGEGRLWSLRSLVSEFPYEADGITLAYAQSAEVVRFVIERWGKERIEQIIDAYATGVSHDDALLAAIGVDTDGLDQLWRESIGYTGDSGMPIGGTDSSSISTGDSLLIESGAIVLTIAAAISFVARARRRRSRGAHEIENELLLVA